MYSIFPIGIAIGIRLVCAGMLLGVLGMAKDFWNDDPIHPWSSRCSIVGLIGMVIGVNIMAWVL